MGTTAAPGGFGSAAGASFPSGTGSIGAGSPTGTGASLRPPAAGPCRFDYDTQSAISNYLCEVDRAYNALDPQCRFRTFVFNVCGPGQAEGAIQRDRYLAHLHGGGCSEEDWIQAILANPDPQRLYPTPLHFAQELQQRCSKQKEEIEALSDLIKTYTTDVEAIVALDKENQVKLAELKKEDVMLRRRWYTLLQKMETLRRLGRPDGEEGLLLQRLQQMQQELSAPGRYRSALEQIQAWLEEEGARRSLRKRVEKNSTSPPDGEEQPLLQVEVDRAIMEAWLKFTGQTQTGIEALHELLQKDTRDMRSVRNRITAT
ncbi:unnamed protein product [Phytomonas sp. EM1]|nr:unnamed protein product [Phytomonas sp. EM1]|eukprot:CCW65448.1 unnamed protein product [Phytomonas sp. isolate EM1]